MVLEEVNRTLSEVLEQLRAVLSRQPCRHRLDGNVARGDSNTCLQKACARLEWVPPALREVETVLSVLTLYRKRQCEQHLQALTGGFCTLPDANEALKAMLTGDRMAELGRVANNVSEVRRCVTELESYAPSLQLAHLNERLVRVEEFGLVTDTALPAHVSRDNSYLLRLTRYLRHLYVRRKVSAREVRQTILALHQMISERDPSLTDGSVSPAEALKRLRQCEHAPWLATMVESIMRDVDRESIATSNSCIPRNSPTFDSSRPPLDGGMSSLYVVTLDGVERFVKMYADVASHERAAADLLRHPHIVSVGTITGDAGQPVGHLFEAVNGGNLSTVHAAGGEASFVGWSFLGKLRVCQSVAGAIAFAHSRGIPHHNITLEQVLVSEKCDKDGAPMVVEWAPVALAEPTDITKQTVSREVIALCLLIWNLFCPGLDHGLGGDADAVFNNWFAGQRPPLEKVPPEIAALIQRCWSTDSTAQASDVVVALQSMRSSIHTAGPGAPVRASNRRFWELIHKMEIEDHFARLPASAWYRGKSSQIVLAKAEPGDPFYHFVWETLRAASTMHITDIFAVQHDLSPLFVQFHESNELSLAENARLRMPAPSDDASQRTLGKLDQTCATTQRHTRVILAWHGTSPECLEKVAADGVRPLGETDPGFFGAGSYFAFEADYAATYSRSSKAGESNSHGIILFAVSVANTLPITVKDHYLTPDEDNAYHTAENRGYCKFCSSATISFALASGFDSHVAPVKDCKDRHPRDPEVCLDHHVGYQACDAKEAEYHELVTSSHLSATPVAIVRFKA